MKAVTTVSGGGQGGDGRKGADDADFSRRKVGGGGWGGGMAEIRVATKQIAGSSHPFQPHPTPSGAENLKRAIMNHSSNSCSFQTPLWW